MACRLHRFAGLLVAAATIVAAVAPDARAETAWPSHPVTIVAPFGAGSALDLLARLIAGHMQAAFGQPFVVENRSGGRGLVGAGSVAHAAPDGYTLLLATSTTHSAVAGMFKAVPYDPLNDFTPVAAFARLLPVFVVTSDLPATSLGEFAGYAKANPGRIDIGYANAAAQIGAEALRTEAGLDVVGVAYCTNAQAIADLLAGRIKATIVDYLSVREHIRVGKLRALGMLSRSRSSLLPDLPTFDETIVPGMEVSAWAGIVGPTGVPRPVVEQLAAEMRKFLARADIQEQFRATAFEPNFIGPDRFPAYLAAELERWTRMSKEAGIEPQ